LALTVTQIYEIDPVQDQRWAEFLERHRCATLFHSAEWLNALHRTYRYRVSAVTTSGPGEPLRNALVFCRVQSWLTGRRIVSVPFSDHCAPLVESVEDLECLLSHLKKELDQGAGRYLEIRSDAGVSAGMTDSASFCLHRLDLRPSLQELSNGLHESCIRRKMAKAQRVGICYEQGTSEQLLLKFYELMVLTRRRHRTLPQPLSWFRNLMALVGEKGRIRLASYGGEPVAAILTICHKATMTYKYGCSDPQFHRLGPMQLLMWKAIQEAKKDELVELDMGRTDWNNTGLLAYKDRWGCARSLLTYQRYPVMSSAQTAGISIQVPKPVYSLTPKSVLSTAGRFVYRHLG
jgi:CelD/BcsL family acetyltransferase involved in cellulose biosynthesis